MAKGADTVVECPPRHHKVWGSSHNAAAGERHNDRKEQQLSSPIGNNASKF